MSQLRLLQGSRVLDEEHQAADQHLSVQGLRLHLEGVDQEVDDPGPQVVEVGEGLVAVGAGDQLLDGPIRDEYPVSRDQLSTNHSSP